MYLRDCQVLNNLRAVCILDRLHTVDHLSQGGDRGEADGSLLAGRPLFADARIDADESASVVNIVWNWRAGL